MCPQGPGLTFNNFFSSARMVFRKVLAFVTLRLAKLICQPKKLLTYFWKILGMAKSGLTALIYLSENLLTGFSSRRQITSASSISISISIFSDRFSSQFPSIRSDPCKQGGDWEQFGGKIHLGISFTGPLNLIPHSQSEIRKQTSQSIFFPIA